MKYLFFLIFSCIVLLPASGPAEVFPISVRSVYLNPRTGQWGKEVTWTFTRIGQDLAQVTPGKTQYPVVLLQYDQSGRLKGVEKLIGRGGRAIRVNEVRSGPIILSEGFPVPYDDLAPHDGEMNEAVIRKQAGGVTFSRTVTREVREIALDMAVAENMVEGQTAQDLSGQVLKLITITKGGELVARQLWAEGALWWVYEETAVRKSWRE